MSEGPPFLGRQTSVVTLGGKLGEGGGGSRSPFPLPRFTCPWMSQDALPTDVQELLPPTHYGACHIAEPPAGVGQQCLYAPPSQASLLVLVPRQSRGCCSPISNAGRRRQRWRSFASLAAKPGVPLHPPPIPVELWAHLYLFYLCLRSASPSIPHPIPSAHCLVAPTHTSPGGSTQQGAMKAM